MNATEAPIHDRIRAFADVVRAHLDDLPRDEVDEIVAGLTSGLAEQAAEGDGALDLGDPAAYAAELRSAAGLPEHAAGRAQPVSVRVRDNLRALAEMPSAPSPAPTAGQDAPTSPEEGSAATPQP